MKYDDKMMEDFLNARKDLIKLHKIIRLTMLEQLPTDDNIFDQKFYELHDNMAKVIDDLDMITDIIRYRGGK